MSIEAPLPSGIFKSVIDHESIMTHFPLFSLLFLVIFSDLILTSVILPVPLCLSVVAVQSRTPALVFECINNTDFKVQLSPLFCMLLWVSAFLFVTTFIGMFF